MKILFKITCSTFFSLNISEFKEKVKEKRCVGEFYYLFDHSKIFVEANLLNISHKINNIKKINNNLIGELEFLMN